MQDGLSDHELLLEIRKYVKEHASDHLDITDELGKRPTRSELYTGIGLLAALIFGVARIL
jgi:hypothetical protein